MAELEKFQELKQKVLLKYQEHYPFFKEHGKHSVRRTFRI